MFIEIEKKTFKWEIEQIDVYIFEMKKDMIITFEKRSYNIFDVKKKVIKELETKDEKVTREVSVEYRYYVMKTKIKFEKKSE